MFAVHLAPRMDKVLIPRTNGHLSTMGIDMVGLVTPPAPGPDSRAPIRWH